MIVKELKGGSLSKTVIIQDEIKKVRKYISNSKDREYGLVRWHSQIRKMQSFRSIVSNSCLPKILDAGVSEDYFYYDMEYLEEYENCLDYLKSSSEITDGDKVFDGLLEILKKCKEHEYEPIQGTFWIYIQEEVISKINFAKSASYIELLDNNERKRLSNLMDSVIEKISRCEVYLKEVALNESFNHGNLTLENTMIDSVGEIKIIDLYFETYCESWLGDLSQLMQSSLGNYEILNELSEEQFFSIFDQPKIPDLSYSYLRFREKLNNYIDRLEVDDKLCLGIFYASQFIRMFPFKVDKYPRKAYFFMVKGLQELSEVLDRVK